MKSTKFGNWVIEPCVTFVVSWIFSLRATTSDNGSGKLAQAEKTFRFSNTKSTEMRTPKFTFAFFAANRIVTEKSFLAVEKLDTGFADFG